MTRRTTFWNAPYTFSGKEKDVETGYGYFGARYYDSGLSIWLSVDPMSYKYPSMSPYNFCANNPIMRIDPNGKWIWQPRNYWKAERGDSPASLAVDAKIPLSVAKEYVSINNQQNQNQRTSETMVYTGDLVYVPTREIINSSVLRVNTVKQHTQKTNNTQKSQSTKEQPSHGAPLSKEALNNYCSSGNPDGVEYFRRFLECTVADFEKDAIKASEPYLVAGGRTVAEMMPTTWAGNNVFIFANGTDIWGNKATVVNGFPQPISAPIENKKYWIKGGPKVAYVLEFVGHLQQQLSSQEK